MFSSVISIFISIFFHSIELVWNIFRCYKINQVRVFNGRATISKVHFYSKLNRNRLRTTTKSQQDDIFLVSEEENRKKSLSPLEESNFIPTSSAICCLTVKLSCKRNQHFCRYRRTFHQGQYTPTRPFILLKTPSCCQDQPSKTFSQL